MTRTPKPRHQPADPLPDGDSAAGAKSGPERKKNVLELPMDDMQGFECRGALFFPGARFQHRTWDIILIPKDGLIEVEFDD